MIGGVNRVNRPRRAERTRLIHRALVAGNIPFVLAKAQGIGAGQVLRRAMLNFLARMASLFEAAPGVFVTLIASGSEAGVRLTDKAAPVVWTRRRSIGVVPADQHRRGSRRALNVLSSK